MSVHSSSWKIRNEQKLTSKVLETSSLPQFEKTSLKREKKYKNHRHAEYHHALKRKKTLSSAMSSEPGTYHFQSECASF